MRFSAFLMAARMDVVLPLLLLMCFVSRRIGSVRLESTKTAMGLYSNLRGRSAA